MKFRKKNENKNVFEKDYSFLTCVSDYYYDLYYNAYYVGDNIYYSYYPPGFIEPKFSQGANDDRTSGYIKIGMNFYKNFQIIIKLCKKCKKLKNRRLY